MGHDWAPDEARRGEGTDRHDPGQLPGAAALLCIGLYAVLTRRNMIKIVMGLSLMEASTYLFMVSLAYRAGSTAPVLLRPARRQDRADSSRTATWPTRCCRTSA